MPRVFLPELSADVSEVEISGPAQHYLTNVLRLEPGRALVVFDGQGMQCQALLQSSSKRSCVISLSSCQMLSRESPLATHLAIGVSKGDRFEWVLQKATELGVTTVTPLWTERTEVRLKSERLAKKQEHWQQVLISACEQCQRNRLPQLQPALPLGEFLLHPDPALKIILHPGGERSLRDLPNPSQLTLLVGPEGGLSDAEIKQAMAQSYQPVTLGPRVLRTETAPVAVLACAQMLWGDLG